MYRRFFAAGMFLIPSLAFAASTVIVPSLELTSTDAARRFAAEHTSKITVHGHGGYMHITYTSASPIDGDTAPMVNHGQFRPEDLSHFTLPAGKDMEAWVDLRPASMWSPWVSDYYLAFYEPASKSPVDVQQLKFEPAGFMGTIRAALMHLSYIEDYQVATPHMLRGYKMLGFSLPFLIGFPVLILCVVFFFLRAKKRHSAVPAILTTCIVGLCVYGAWFGMDVVRFSFDHLHEWEANGTYAQAGSIYQIADALKKEAFVGHAPTEVFVCTMSTNYETKVLRYLMYPVPVSQVTEDVQKSTHIVVLRMADWSYDKGVLHCGSITGKATKVQDFPDGSALFTTYHS